MSDVIEHDDDATPMTDKYGRPIAKGRIRPALLTAIRLIVEEGLTQADAAKRVGYKQESLSSALRKPHVQVVVAGVKRAWLDSRTSRAWVNVAQLADGAVSEDVKLKANRIFLEAAGELGGDDRDASKRAQTLIQIVTDKVNIGQHPLSERLPGVVEAPAYRVIEHDRQTPDESDGSE